MEYHAGGKPLEEFLSDVQESPNPVIIRIGEHNDMLTQAIDSAIQWTIYTYQLTVRVIAIEYEEDPEIAAHFYAQPHVPLVAYLWKGHVLLAFETETGIPSDVASLISHVCKTIQDYPEIICGIIHFAPDYVEIQGNDGKDAILVLEDKDEITSRDEFARSDPPIADGTGIALLGRWRDQNHFQVKFISRGKYTQMSPP